MPPSHQRSRKRDPKPDRRRALELLAGACPPSGPNWVHEIKHDGFWLMALPQRRTVRKTGDMAGPAASAAAAIATTRGRPRGSSRRIFQGIGLLGGRERLTKNRVGRGVDDRDRTHPPGFSDHSTRRS